MGVAIDGVQCLNEVASTVRVQHLLRACVHERACVQGRMWFWVGNSPSQTHRVLLTVGGQIPRAYLQNCKSPEITLLTHLLSTFVMNSGKDVFPGRRLSSDPS